MPDQPTAGSTTVTVTNALTGLLSGDAITGTLSFRKSAPPATWLGNLSSTIASSGQGSVQAKLTR
jgi:hypothetical protein